MAVVGGGALFAYMKKQQMDREADAVMAQFDISELNRALLINETDAKKAVFSKNELETQHLETIREAHRTIAADCSKIVKVLENSPGTSDAITRTCDRNASRLACALCVVDNARTIENIESRYRSAVCVYFEEAIEDTTFKDTFAVELPKIQSVLNYYDCNERK